MEKSSKLVGSIAKRYGIKGNNESNLGRGKISL